MEISRYVNIKQIKMKRTPLKRGKLKMKTTSSNSKAKERLKEQTRKKEELYEFFVELWLSIPPGDRRCKSCGKQLLSPTRNYYFDHLIEKSKRPDLAMERDNIFLCCLACHSLKTDGHPTEAHKKAIEKAKEKFGLS